MKPKMLVLLAAFAAVAVIVIYMFISTASSARHEDTSTTTAASDQPVATDHRDRATANGGTSVGSAAPHLPGTNDLAQGSAQNPKDYMIGDVRVRDHRTGDNKPLDLPPNQHPAEGRELPATLTHDISQQVKKLVWSCGADVPKDARGTKPRVDGQLTVSIKDHTLTINTIAAQVRDVDGPSADTLKQCVEQKSVGLTSVASDQADITDYGIGITFAIP